MIDAQAADFQQVVAYTGGETRRWQMLLFPGLLPMPPLRCGVLFILMLSFINMAEWSVLLSRGLN